MLPRPSSRTIRYSSNSSGGVHSASSSIKPPLPARSRRPSGTPARPRVLPSWSRAPCLHVLASASHQRKNPPSTTNATSTPSFAQAAKDQQGAVLHETLSRAAQVPRAPRETYTALRLHRSNTTTTDKCDHLLTEALYLLLGRPPPRKLCLCKKTPPTSPSVTSAKRAQPICQHRQSCQCTDSCRYSPQMHTLPVDGFEQVLRLDCAGVTAFLAIHSRIAGRSFGGIRIRAYPSEQLALDDALALSRAMSRKAVLAGIRGGGAKTVMVLPDSANRRSALIALAAVIEALEGRYYAGGDYGFTPEDGEIIGTRTRFLASGDLDNATAAGVEAALCALFIPQQVALQGLGRVGLALARRLLQRGITVIAADPRPPANLPPEIRLVDPQTITSVECDVFAPCAHGGLLTETEIRTLRCQLVCGAANNPLASAADAQLLHRRGITYVPDFVANAGGLIHGASMALGEADRIDKRMAALPTLVREITDRAAAQGRSPYHVAIELADARLASLRDPPPRTPRPVAEVSKNLP
ncbi:MAG TPA: hypothetical protein ENJ18_10180 [Nannocystis exedens]|nr:hypothetical protein [Nannocystis exedens]